MRDTTIRTPGTRLEFASLAEWLTCAAAIEGRRPSAGRYAAARAHFHALPDAMVETAEGDAVQAFIDLLAGHGNLEWHKPSRGHRGGTRWEDLNVRARNRRSQLERAADAELMGMGHNSQGAPRLDQ
jgi:hypothetical protein